MNLSRIIGGEFDVDLQTLQYIHSNANCLNGVYTYASGRSALYYILLNIQKTYGIDTVFLPDYLCSSIVVAAEKSHVKVVFYPLNDKLEIDVEKFPLHHNEKAAILLINYFGLQTLHSQINFIHSISQNVILIEDDVQAFYEFRKDELNVNYKFTSLRKSFACPDGGLVKTNQPMDLIHEINRFHQYKLAASILKSLRKPEYYDDEVYLHLFEKGEQLIDDEITMSMSQISHEVIAKTDFERIAFIRKRNAKQILEGLKALGIQTILPVESDKIPLFIPVWLKNRDKVRKHLFRHQIFCPVHWPMDGLDLKKGKNMSEHEMSIIIDQRYTNKDMSFILNTLEEALR